MAWWGLSRAIDRWGKPGFPAQLHVQMSSDGVVREVFMLEEYQAGREGRD
jgi:hypothetical protein